ncbi:MAG TPA: response regulator [Thermoanaerobaculia bacterium]|nr:response regulator [Thermoanaerobaculia bacterium]
MNDLYNCFHCDAINRVSKNSWCCCVGSENSLVCNRCGQCFCTAPDVWKKPFWERFSAVLTGGRDAEQSYARPIILIVDDDKVIHSVASRVLADFRGTVLHAYDGAEGLRIAQTVRPDLVLTDCLLPLKDGREIARVLKSDWGTSHIRVVAMTSLYRGARYRHEALTHYNVDAYVEKPITAAKLLEIANSTRAVACS